MPWLGTVCCLLSAVGYTGANICLRQLAEIEADPAWVICLKETTAILVFGPWFLWQFGRGVRLSCARKSLMILVLAALTVQLIGNLGIQWAFGIIGLVISLPMVFGAMLVAGTFVGAVVFGEQLSVRSLAAVAAVLVSIVLLSLGSAERSDQSAVTAGPLLTSLAVTAAGIGGVTFATLGAALRHAAGARVPVPITVIVVTGTGSISLGLLSLIRLGPWQMLATDPHTLAWIVASGLCNVAAFAFITQGVKLTTLMHANALNASQVAMGTLAGIIFFQESYNAWLFAGVLLTISGIVLFDQSRKPEPSPTADDMRSQ